MSALLAESFDALRLERRDAWGWFAQTLGAIRVRVDLGDEAFVVAAAPDGPVVTDGEADVHVETTPRTVLAVLDAELTLTEAVWSGRLQVVGTATHLSTCHDALLAYVHGGVRTASFPGLLERFRRTVQQGAA